MNLILFEPLDLGLDSSILVWVEITSFLFDRGMVLEDVKFVGDDVGGDRSQACRHRTKRILLVSLGGKQ